jgi:hypothetical protein
VESDKTMHKPAKKPRSRVPPPQRARILQKYVAGKSVVQISREENRNRETVAKIVKGKEMEEFVNEMRDRFYGLAGDALDAIQHNLCKNKDGHLAYRLLTDIGVVPTVEERQTVAAMSQPQETQDERVEKLVAGFTRLAMESYSAFGRPLPDVNEVEAELERKRRRNLDIPLLSGKD